jgi:hypothetical protein
MGSSAYPTEKAWRSGVTSSVMTMTAKTGSWGNTALYRPLGTSGSPFNRISTK